MENNKNLSNMSNEEFNNYVDQFTKYLEEVNKSNLDMIANIEKDCMELAKNVNNSKNNTK